ncbi:hypothetical protein JVU11DRAFT_2956 [Chiua virens]|nr:hypothetical protein JVU11DRAFT_2956 [Chiua virens]
MLFVTTTMSLSKLPLLIASSIFFHSALDYPSPASPEDKIMVKSVQEHIWRYAGLPCALFLKSMTWLATAAESAVILGAVFGPPCISSTTATVLGALGPAKASKLTEPFLLGTLLIMMGGVHPP